MDKPFLHLFILTKIRDKATNDFIDRSILKEQIARIILRKGGLPKFMVKYVIQDLIDLGIIEQINNNGLFRLNKIKEEKRIRNLLI